MLCRLLWEIALENEWNHSINVLFYTEVFFYISPSLKKCQMVFSIPVLLHYIYVTVGRVSNVYQYYILGKCNFHISSVHCVSYKQLVFGSENTLIFAFCRSKSARETINQVMMSRYIKLLSFFLVWKSTYGVYYAPSHSFSLSCRNGFLDVSCFIDRVTIYIWSELLSCVVFNFYLVLYIMLVPHPYDQ